METWLLTKGKVTKTATAVEKVNKPLEKISETKLAEIKEPPPPAAVQESFRAALKSPPLRNTIIIMMFLFIASAIITCYIAVFGGLVRMSENLGLDFFTTFSLTSVTEIPSGVFVALLMDRIGRRAMTGGTLAISSVFIVTIMLLPNGIYVTVMALGARLFVKMTYLAIIQWVTELLPTKVRALGSSIMHVLGSIAIAFSPYISPARGLWVLVPLMLLALITLIAIAAVMFLPETGSRKLPQTYAETEQNIIQYTLLGYYNPETLKNLIQPPPIGQIRPKRKKKSKKRKKKTDKKIKPSEKAKVEEILLVDPKMIDKKVKPIKGEKTAEEHTEEEDSDEEDTEEEKTEEEDKSDVPPEKGLHDAPARLNFFKF